MAFCAAALAMFAQASTKENLHTELIRLQNQSGPSLVSFEGAGRNGNLYVVAFATRSLSEKRLLKDENVGEGAISSDGTEIAFELRRQTAHLGVVRQDGSNLREYPDFDEPYDPCWSFDKSALALNVKNSKLGKDSARGLQVLNLGSGATEMIDAKGYVTAQCWSPDGKEIVYETDQTLRVYDVRKQTSGAGTPCLLSFGFGLSTSAIARESDRPCTKFGTGLQD
jgi:WD40 repeat protein